jgi:hypothetical protein
MNLEIGQYVVVNDSVLEQRFVATQIVGLEKEHVQLVNHLGGKVYWLKTSLLFVGDKASAAAVQKVAQDAVDAFLRGASESDVGAVEDVLG